jgi:tetratricopeptide (TPR) repeat protein
VRRCLIVLTAAAAWHPVTAAALFALLRRLPGLVAHASAPVVQLVVDRAPDDLAAAVDSALPRYSAELLWPGAALARRLYDALPATAAAHRAHRLENLGLRLSMLGRRQDAVMATTEADEIYRRLADTNRTEFEPDLAGSLNNLSVMPSDLGLHRDALAASTHAVDIRRRLAAVNPTAFEPHLARALTNHGADLSDLGQSPHALAVTAEAIAIHRRSGAAHPAVFEPDLARGLWVFARVRAAGQEELPQAVTAGQESVTLFQGLVRQRPRVFTDDLRGARATVAEVLESLHRGQRIIS